jgi:hypothetical protein
MIEGVVKLKKPNQMANKMENTSKVIEEKGKALSSFVSQLTETVDTKLSK